MLSNWLALGTPFSEDATNITSSKWITHLKAVIKIVWFNFATVKFCLGQHISEEQTAPPCLPLSGQCTALWTLRWQQLLDTGLHWAKVPLRAVLASPFYRWETLGWKWCYCLSNEHLRLSEMPILKPNLHVTGAGYADLGGSLVSMPSWMELAPCSVRFTKLHFSCHRECEEAGRVLNRCCLCLSFKETAFKMGKQNSFVHTTQSMMLLTCQSWAISRH